MLLSRGGGLGSVTMEWGDYLAEGVEDVLNSLDELGAVFDKLVGPDRAWRVDAAGDGHYFAILIYSGTGGDQCAATYTGLYYYGSECEP